MARLLIQRRDNHRPNRKRPQTAYRPGDIVAVVPDGHDWGRVWLPVFDRVDVPALSVEQVRFYIEPRVWFKAEFDGPEPQIERRRAVYLDAARLPARKRHHMQRGGMVQLTPRELLHALVRHQTRLTEWRAGRRGF